MKKDNKITINGVTYPCRLSIGAMNRYKRITGTDVSKMDNEDFEAVSTLIYCCLVSGCSAESVDHPFKSADHLADHLAVEELPAMVESVFGISVAAPADADTAKKKD